MMVQFDGTPESSKLLVVQNFISIKRNISLKEKWPKIMSPVRFVPFNDENIAQKDTYIKVIDNYHTPLYNMLS